MSPDSMSPDTGHQDEPIGLPGIDLAPTVLIDLAAWLGRTPAASAART
ncbi:hypothetical protein [Cryobacterium arcticum]|nr:hypothetical protein [Cryobacterium arcticum]